MSPPETIEGFYGRWVTYEELQDGDVIFFARNPGSTKTIPTRWHKNPRVGTPSYKLKELRRRGLDYFIAVERVNEFGPEVP